MCTVCKYNQVKDIDRALLAGATPASLTKKYRFSLPDLQHHQKHLVQKMAQADQRFHDNLHQFLFCKLTLVMEMVLGVVQGAKGGGDFKLFLQASREFTRIISLMHKMNVRLEPEFIYCLMATPQWDLQEEGLLPAAFQALSKTRQTLKVNLYAHCPDPEPEPEPKPMPPPTLETRNSELKTSTAGHCPDPLPKASFNLAPLKGNEPETGKRQETAPPARN
jgi:hypothetical protein